MINSRPEMVIIAHLLPNHEQNLTSAFLQKFRQAGIKVVTYTWTNYGERKISDVLLDIDSQLKAG